MSPTNKPGSRGEGKETVRGEEGRGGREGERERQRETERGKRRGRETERERDRGKYLSKMFL
jgi:hypothetical protein